MQVDYLRSIPVFSELNAQELELIQGLTIERRYKKNMQVFMEGEPGEGFHYVKHGRIKIVKLAVDGREHIIKFIAPGEVFAEVLLFNKGAYPATAVAQEDSVVGMIRNTELEKVVLAHPQLALNLIKVLSKKLLFVQQKIKTIVFADSYAKTAQALAGLAQQYGIQTPRGIEIDADITRQDVANLVGATRETVSRVFSMMKKDKVLDGDERRIIILNMEGLKEYFAHLL